VTERSFTVELPLPPRALSPNARVHWSVRARETKAYRYVCGLIARAAKPKEWDACAVAFQVEYRCSRGCDGYMALDVANAMAAIKPLPDGFVDAGIAPNDSKKWLQWDQFNLVTRKHPKGDGVTVIVRAV
jgi:crossover junction endodeoxyribonuclease RusA